jgi:hypothetical protein
MLRDNFGDIAVDRHDLDTHTDAGDKAPQNQAFGRGLKCHDGRADGIPEQGEGEHGPAPIAIRQPAESKRTDEETRERGRDEAGHPLKAEKCPGGGLQQPAPGHAGCDIAREDQVIDLEEAAERNEEHHHPDIASGGQAIHSCRQHCGAAIQRSDFG